MADKEIQIEHAAQEIAEIATQVKDAEGKAVANDVVEEAVEDKAQEKAVANDRMLEIQEHVIGRVIDEVFKEKITINKSQQEMIKGIIAEITEGATKAEEKGAETETELQLEGKVEEEEGEGEEEEEEEEMKIDREVCITDLRNLLLERRPLYKRNLLLQSKLAEYFGKHNMEYAYAVTQTVKEKEKQQKYNNQLLLYDKLKNQEEEERKAADIELSSLNVKLSEIMNHLEEDFDVLQTRERDLAQGLIYTKTGKPIPDKVLERLLARQADKRKNVSKVRINYIKLRNYVAKKEAEKRALEKVGEGLHLMDYEQLRMENQSIKDKIEERDEELQRLRYKATSSISILAHVKEKSNETNTHISELHNTLASTSQNLMQARETANTQKKKREWLRRELQRLRKEAGLLVQPKLLHHFEETMEAVNQLSTQLQNLRNSYADNQRRLLHSRGSIKAITKGSKK